MIIIARMDPSTMLLLEGVVIGAAVVSSVGPSVGPSVGGDGARLGWRPAVGGRWRARRRQLLGQLLSGATLLWGAVR